MTLLLADAEWSQWSDREIARRCQVSHKFVQQVRRSSSGDGRQMRLRKVLRGATVYTMRAESKSSQPAAPDRGVSTPAEAPSTPATDRLGIRLPSVTAAAFELELAVLQLAHVIGHAGVPDSTYQIIPSCQPTEHAFCARTMNVAWNASSASCALLSVRRHSFETIGP